MDTLFTAFMTTIALGILAARWNVPSVTTLANWVSTGLALAFLACLIWPVGWFGLVFLAIGAYGILKDTSTWENDVREVAQGPWCYPLVLIVLLMGWHGYLEVIQVAWRI